MGLCKSCIINTLKWLTTQKQLRKTAIIPILMANYLEPPPEIKSPVPVAARTGHKSLTIIAAASVGIIANAGGKIND